MPARRPLVGTVFALVAGSILLLAQAGAPAAPIGLAASVAGSTVTLTWQPGAGEAPLQYQVEAALVPLGPVIAALRADVPTLTVTQVPDGTYFVHVRAVNAGGASAPSNEVMVTIGAPPCGVPNAPGPLTHSVNGSIVSLAWVPPGGGCPVTQYFLQAGSAPGLANIANLNVGQQLTLQTTAPPGTYFVRVVAANASGLSSPSNEDIVSLVPSCTAPGAPLGFNASANGSMASLGWQPPVTGGAPTSYILEAGSTPSTSNLAVLTVGGLSYTTSVGPGTYYVRVRATNDCGPGPASVTQQLTVICPPPGTPGTPATSVSGTTATLSWAGVAGASQYQVEVGTAAGASNVTTRAVVATSTQISGLPAGVYFTRIRATNACGTGGASGEAIFTVQGTSSGPTCNGGSVPASVSCGVPTAGCRDGSWSCSQNRSGTCSSHGGVSCWVCPGRLC